MSEINSFLALSSHSEIKNSKKKNRNKNKESHYYKYSPVDQNDSKNLALQFLTDSSDMSDGEELGDLQLGRNRNMATTRKYNLQDRISESRQELVYSKKKIRNIRIILLVLGAIVLIALIAVLVIILTKSASDDDEEQSNLAFKISNQETLKLDDVINNKYYTKKFNGSWHGTNIIYNDVDKLVELNVTSSRKINLLNLGDYRYRYTFAHQKSPDGEFMLAATEFQKFYRHSYLAKYLIINLKTHAISPITIKGNHEPLFLAKWSPIGNGLILNYRGNLYYKSNPLQNEIQITDTEDLRVFNGIPDWVYEEEVFSSNEAVWFNPNGSKIAFVQFDDTPTRPISIPIYGEPAKVEFQYPLQKPVSYPKSGSPNPYVKLFQVDLDNLHEGSQVNLIPVPVPSALNTENHIISIVQWLNNEQLLSVWMNRIQNSSHFEIFSSRKRYDLIKFESQTGWVDIFTPCAVNKDGSKIALILPHNQGEAGDYRHLSLITIKENSKPISLTSGKFVVQSILKWDSDNNLIFYMANTPERSEILHLYAIKAAKNEKPQCITCGLKINGEQQDYFSADFCENGRFLALTSSGPNIPRTDIYEYTLNSRNIILKKVMDWQNNDKVRDRLKSIQLPTREIYTISIEQNFTAKVLLTVPYGIKRNGDKKYPMIVDVYGGPDSNAVVNKFSIDYGTYLASNRLIVYARIDGRGSGMRGDKLMHSIYMKLGTAEVKDQYDVALKLTEKLAFIDPKRIGIWGWSYGGYVSGLTIAKSNVFKCGVSVAPVTDWMYYDTIYTERYMKTPEENELGYTQSRLSTLGSRFHNKTYLIIHGTLDDNVHYQQGMMLVKNLEENVVLFKQITYPDEDHSLANVRPHLYNSLDRFFGVCFGLETSQYFR